MSLKYYFFLSSLLQYLKGTSGQQLPLSEKEVIYVQESVRPCPELKTGSKWYAAHYAQLLSRIWLFGAPWSLVHQAPVSMGFSRQKFWSGSPSPPQGDLPQPGIEPSSPASPALAGRFFTTEPSGKLPQWYISIQNLQKKKKKKKVFYSDKITKPKIFRTWPVNVKDIEIITEGIINTRLIIF